MRGSFLCAVICATVALVLTSKCPHNDVSACTSLECDDPAEVVGCEHDICTCVPDHGHGGNAGHGGACTDVADCTITCKHDQMLHCIDSTCKCEHIH